MSWETVRTIDLGYEQMLALHDRRGTRVRVLYGALWLTEEGEAGDRFPASGEEVVLKSRGLTLLEGMGAARVQLVEPPRATWRARLAGALRGARGRLATRRWRAAAVRAALFAGAAAVSLAVLEAAIPGPPTLAAGAEPQRLALAGTASVPVR
jgi:hypothetical protein